MSDGPIPAAKVSVSVSMLPSESNRYAIIVPSLEVILSILHLKEALIARALAVAATGAVIDVLLISNI